MDGEQIANKEMNQEPYCCLLHCMNDEICFNLVDTAKTENLPDGDAAPGWKNLSTRYEPNYYGFLLTLKQDFVTKTLKNVNRIPIFCTLKSKKFVKKFKPRR